MVFAGIKKKAERAGTYADVYSSWKVWDTNFIILVHFADVQSLNKNYKVDAKTKVGEECATQQTRLFGWYICILG